MLVFLSFSGKASFQDLQTLILQHGPACTENDRVIGRRGEQEADIGFELIIELASLALRHFRSAKLIDGLVGGQDQKRAFRGEIGPDQARGKREMPQ